MKYNEISIISFYHQINNNKIPPALVNYSLGIVSRDIVISQPLTLLRLFYYRCHNQLDSHQRDSSPAPTTPLRTESDVSAAVGETVSAGVPTAAGFS